jgi:hypothetical protein
LLLYLSFNLGRQTFYLVVIGGYRNMFHSAIDNPAA